MDGLKLTLRPRGGVAGGEMVFAGDKLHSMTFVEGLSGQPIRIDGAFQEAEDFVDQARMDMTDPQPGPLRDLAWPHGLPFVLDTPQPYYIWAQVGMEAYKFPLLMGNETTGGLTDAPATLQMGGRLVHGIVLFAAYKDECVGDRRTLEVLIGPWIALFGYSRRRRVWKGTAADILETMVQEYGNAYGGAPTTHCNLKDLSRRDFSVQMDESDLVFLMRVLERDNIFLNFRHDSQGTHITLCQDNDDAKLDVLDGRPMRLSYNRDDIVELMDDVVTDVGMRSRLVPNQYMMRDYNPQNAAARLVAQYPADKGVHQVYDYPGGFQKLTSGVDTMAKRRMNAFAHQKWFLRVESICPDMMPGAVLSLPLEGAERLPGIGPGDRFMVCLVRHELRRRRPDGAGIFRNVFEALRTDVPFSPSPLPDRPPLQVPQIANVVAEPESELVDIDKDVHALIVFKWDDQAKPSPVRARIGQPWAGARWGTMNWPRNGDEVLVEFIDGDPDRPCIICSLYNSRAKPAYPPPAQTHNMLPQPVQNRLMTGLTDRGGNGMLMYDKRDEELLLVSAKERRGDFTGGDFEDITFGDRSLRVGGDLDLKVMGNFNITVGGTVTIEMFDGAFVRANKGVHTTIKDGTVDKPSLLDMPDGQGNGAAPAGQGDGGQDDGGHDQGDRG
ncbi:type VI secretion system Vgr family protein [Marinibaculum pumilum]|uniref:Type VI secretion system Vgr family protein n=1 Tax=Marinibaculum pumilum TaxID=1766165 RepID=A0ABV7KXT4_9PROT